MKLMIMLGSKKIRQRSGMIKKIMRKEFKDREQVLLYNSKLKLFLGKLKSRWSGLYTVVASTPFGAVTLKTDSGSEFKVNGQRLKHYLRGNINED